MLDYSAVFDELLDREYITYTDLESLFRRRKVDFPLTAVSDFIVQGLQERRLAVSSNSGGIYFLKESEDRKKE